MREAFAPNAIAKRVAERHEISTGLLFTWRRQLMASGPGGFLPVQLVRAEPDPPGPSPTPSRPSPPGVIEIDMPNGAQVRVGQGADLTVAAQGKAPAVVSPICLKAVQQIGALLDIERDINGCSADERRAARQTLSAPLMADLQSWLGKQRAKLARGNDVARAIDYVLKRWTAFTRFLDDGRLCLRNNAAERALRGIAMSQSL